MKLARKSGGILKRFEMQINLGDLVHGSYMGTANNEESLHNASLLQWELIAKDGDYASVFHQRVHIFEWYRLPWLRKDINSAIQRLIPGMVFPGQSMLVSTRVFKRIKGDPILIYKILRRHWKLLESLAKKKEPAGGTRWSGSICGGKLKEYVWVRIILQ